jgi:DNA-binding NtrC family response regulator
MSVLLISNDSELAAAVESAAASVRGCVVRWVAGLDELGSRLLDESVCLAIVHVGVNGERAALDDAIREACLPQPRVATLVIRDVYDGEHELWCHRVGVRECLTRPLDLGRLAYVIDALTIRARLQGAQGTKKSPPVEEHSYGTTSPVMRTLLRRAKRVAARDVSILLNGETGAGKTYLARWIHDASPRAARPFITVNCGSLPANLIESELFGHKRGAFTGADEERVGKFAYVQDGTLLLDEVDALSLAAQAKLLRVLDEGVFERVGCNKSLPFRGRLIAASNRPLEELIEQGQFRADLYYRLNVVQFSVPSLRSRMEEVRPLARQFLNSLAKKHNEAVPGVDHQVWRVLESYHWPGNLRELRNAVEHALADCEGGTIGVEHLPKKLRQREAGVAARDPKIVEPVMAGADAVRGKGLAQARQMGEYRYLLGVLDMCDNNRSEAARTLGISRTALYKKLESFGIS